MVNENLPRGEDRPVAVEFADALLRVTLVDGRVIATPLEWYPTLLSATPEQRQAYELSPVGIHWEQLDEDLSVLGMLQGNRPPQRKVKA